MEEDRPNAAARPALAHPDEADRPGLLRALFSNFPEKTSLRQGRRWAGPLALPNFFTSCWLRADIRTKVCCGPKSEGMGRKKGWVTPVYLPVLCL